MNTDILKLEPKEIWKHFSNLNAVPRPSKKEGRVIAFMLDFAKSLGLESKQDKVGNVLIIKPATKGFENRKTVVMQSHLDMVHQKNNNTSFDFDSQGIQMKIEEDWIKAEGTTLGADNGIGVATIMAILASNNINHPKIEALFTVDEETGMTGAQFLDKNLLSGTILLNLDTEEDDEICIGCAGGIDVTAERFYEEETVDVTAVGYKIEVKGLEGGHSGIDIHKGLGNANKIMNRLLYKGYEKYGLRISSVQGGSLRNAIPRESEAKVVVDKINEQTFVNNIKSLSNIINKEQERIDPSLLINVLPIEAPRTVMSIGVQEQILNSIYTAHNGVYRMSPEIENLVEASNNIAKINISKGELKIECLTRSSVSSSRDDVANALQATFELSGCKVSFGGAYPGWQPKKDSTILKLVDNTYFKLHNEQANVMACHAGLECGIIGQHYPEMEMISFGPTIRGAHSPDERVSITSVQKYWKLVLAVLEDIPKAF